jgi:hypothetical protein
MAEQARTYYAARFPPYFDFVVRAGEAAETSTGFASLRFYRFTPVRVKILDEQEFGEEVYVTANITV